MRNWRRAGLAAIADAVPASLCAALAISIPHARLVLTALFTVGGDSFDIATSCSGGRRDDRCFSARFMWRTDGKGEIYTYLPPDYAANKAVCDVAPESECNDTYGASVGRGSFKFTAGTRATIGQRVRLNDVGKQNGELELFVEGKSIFTVSGLVLRDSSAGRFQGIQMQTFFGGAFLVAWIASSFFRGS